MTEAEIEHLMTAAKGNRYGHRDATMILVAYRRGLRTAELADLQWQTNERFEETFGLQPVTAFSMRFVKAFQQTSLLARALFRQFPFQRSQNKVLDYSHFTSVIEKSIVGRKNRFR
jgi:hypothetical protein